VYDKTPVAIERAVGPQKKPVKIVTYDERVFYFDSIYFKNDGLYGIMEKSARKNILEIKLQEENIKEVYIKVFNKSKSKKRTILWIIIPCSIVFVFGTFVLLVNFVNMGDDY
jgi:hypothetical protein